MTNSNWAEVLNTLKGVLGANSFSNWIEPLEFAECANGVAVFDVPTNFIGNYVSQNFGEQILYHLKKQGSDVSRLQFRVPSAARPAPKPKPAPRTAQAEEQSSPLDARFTFDTFVVGKPNELAHAAARLVADSTLAEAPGIALPALA